MSAEERLRDAITRTHYVIVESLDPNIILSYLLSGDVLTSSDVEIVDSKVTNNAKCSKIMAVVHKKGIADVSIYQKFMNALYQADSNKVKFIIDCIEKARDDTTSRLNWSTPLSEEQKYVWLHNRHLIADSLEVSSVIDWLISEGVVNHVEAEAISSGDTSFAQAKRLLKVVERRGTEGYVKFREALDKHGYSKLAYFLSTHVDDSGMLAVWCVVCVCVCVCVCVRVCACVRVCCYLCMYIEMGN